jgi:hypothetical protein
MPLRDYFWCTLVAINGVFLFTDSGALLFTDHRSLEFRDIGLFYPMKKR